MIKDAPEFLDKLSLITKIDKIENYKRFGAIIKTVELPNILLTQNNIAMYLITTKIGKSYTIINHMTISLPDFEADTMKVH